MKAFGDTEAVELFRDNVGAARRVRQEDKLLAGSVKSLQGIYHAGKDGDAVVHDAPEIEDKTFILVDDIAHALEDWDAHGRSPAVSGVSGGSWLFRGSPKR